MKRLALTVFLLASLLSLFSCADSDKKEEETTKKSDWRNTIQYESSFFVNEELRFLYAFDKGTITLWDNAGNGEVFQVIEYDTGVADAIERIEKEDFSGDGNCDIRIIYSESEAGTRYTLWLWSENTNKFVQCRLYSSITDPVIDEATGHVLGVEDKGVFGSISREYAFNDKSGLDVVKSTFSETDSVANNLAKELYGAQAVKSEGAVTINGKRCEFYTVTGELGYIAFDEDLCWYTDRACRGFYREIEQKDSKVTFGSYVGPAKTAEELCVLIKSEGAEALGFMTGSLGGVKATHYEMEFADGSHAYFVNDENGLWYYSADNTAFKKINTSTGAVSEGESFEFALVLTLE